jgi:hypothetical protein
MFVAILAILTGVTGVARLTRIVVYDDYPPAMWWRDTWGEITKHGPWEKLFTCWWCLAPWIALVAILWWMFLIPLHPAWMFAWWAWWGMLAAGYVATMIIVRDTPNE